MARSAAEMRPPAEDSDTPTGCRRRVGSEAAARPRGARSVTPPTGQQPRRLGCGKIAPLTSPHPRGGRPGGAREEEPSRGKMTTLRAEDAHSFGAYRPAPAGKPKAGIVVIQEIFGVNSHIKKVTDGFAADGYVVLAPAIFDRAERGFESGYTPEDLARGRAIRGKIDINDMIQDLRAAVASLAAEGGTGC